MDDDGEDSVAVGAEEARRAAVLRPLVQAFLKRTGSLESGINDAVWELGVSRTTVWRWIKRLAEEGGRTSALAPRKRGRPTGKILISNKVEAVIEEHLRRYFLRRERTSGGRIPLHWSSHPNALLHDVRSSNYTENPIQFKDPQARTTRL